MRTCFPSYRSLTACPRPSSFPRAASPTDSGSLQTSSYYALCEGVVDTHVCGSWLLWSLIPHASWPVPHDAHAFFFLFFSNAFEPFRQDKTRCHCQDTPRAQWLGVGEASAATWPVDAGPLLGTKLPHVPLVCPYRVTPYREQAEGETSSAAETWRYGDG